MLQQGGGVRPAGSRLGHEGRPGSLRACFTAVFPAEGLWAAGAALSPFTDFGGHSSGN